MLSTVDTIKVEKSKHLPPCFLYSQIILISGKKASQFYSIGKATNAIRTFRKEIISLTTNECSKHVGHSSIAVKISSQSMRTEWELYSLMSV